MIWVEIVLSIAFVFVTREWIMDTYAKDPVTFVIWTALWIVAGISIGRRTSSEQHETRPGQGWLSHFFSRVLSRITRRRRMRRTLEGLTPELWGIVKQAYEQGEVIADAHNPYVNMLIEAGVMYAPPVLDVINPNPFMLDPDYRRYLGEIWDSIEWVRK